MAEFKEQYRVVHYEGVGMRNRAEKHLVEYTKKMLKSPLALTIHEVRAELQAEIARTKEAHPSWGTCSLSNVQIAAKMANAHHLVQRSFCIIGRGRQTYTLLIGETVMKNLSLNCAPVLPHNPMPV